MAWKRTSCALCGNNCGLRVQVEDNRIVKVLPDKDNLTSEGYVCRKGLSIAFNQHNADRVLYPLKRAGDGFERISWDQAITEITGKLKGILDEHGPRSLASLVSAQGCHYGIPFLARFVRMLGSRWSYSAANQEFAGRYWAHGLTLGSQAMGFAQDYENDDMLMAIGWNPLMSPVCPTWSWIPRTRTSSSWSSTRGSRRPRSWPTSTWQSAPAPMRSSSSP